MTEMNTIPYFAFHLADHCNLNCKGCDHFAPLAEPSYADLDTFKNDFERLSGLLEVERIGLMGGEPLLNPDLNSFLEISRKYFPKTNIQLVTNGILLKKQKHYFWTACNAHDIEIVVTKYPIQIDFELIEQLAIKNNVRFKYYGNTDKAIKTSYKIPLDLEGCGNIKENFSQCFHAFKCSFLSNGRMFPCTIAPNVIHFNKKFNQKLPLTDQDSIDIYSVNSGKEIIEFLHNPIPFCRYCLIKGRMFQIPWERSKREIEEWTI